ncbi:ribosome-binding factor A [Butyrivibrio sp. INlla18]|jgi:ribosome-binding factor A|uniref:30S ribosome-binding factor RbfA n=1 Tax=unclassified Butyrivibrio TaxID=2639466 RepID=UPI00087F0ADD|nr:MULTISPECIES: 30S ribosome-binding factor RbfA [unclassified Butyrivibrio]MBE5842162.1 30S ribosome-binding factor RbfA [Butyrivibrio sp.]MCR4757205.1 30S ribosome-binding factor RbfA [Butyrivibrio sp.]SDA37768.1 ribosome-binding factor A [Butyrivibrio sp. INlla18]
MRKNSNKNKRINGEVQKVISEAIRYSKDPRISPFTSVMDVEVAPDLKTCKVWVTVMGNDEDRLRTAEGLKSAAGYIRSTVAKQLNMRYTPELRFIMDDSIEYAINMSKIIDEVTAKDNEARAARGEDIEDELEDSADDDSFEEEE